MLSVVDVNRVSGSSLASHKRFNINLLCITGSTMVYKHAELVKATDDFAESAIIGIGGFGMVFEGKIRCCNVAVKRLTEVSYTYVYIILGTKSDHCL